MLTLGIVVFGYVSYLRLPINLMPDVSYPSITVRTEYPGSPSDVEELIAKPLEQALGVTSNLVNITSISRADVADIVLEFAWGTDMDDVSQSIREKLGRVRLPREASTPLLLRYDPSLDPILRIGIHGGDEFAMRRIAEDEVKREIESLSGVAAVKIQGGLEKEIQVEANPQQLVKYRLNLLTIARRLSEENVNVASGRIEEADVEYFVRSINQFRNLEEIKNVAVARAGDEQIKVGDIARVAMTHKTREVITRINGKNAVEIAIYKEGDANIVEVARRVKFRLFGAALRPQKRSRPDSVATTRSASQGNKSPQTPGEILTGPQPLERLLPQAMRLAVLSDQSVFISKAIAEVKNTAVLGALLAMGVLFIFLKKLSTTLIISVAIPISIVTTFAPMYIYHVSLNIMSLGGLALGVGMLVDTSIVVLEAIYRRHEQGEDMRAATSHGTREVAGAVIASTLTTIAVFFPIVFVEGIAGQIFQDQALTVVFSLLASLIVALFVIPMLATRTFVWQQPPRRATTRWHSWQELREALVRRRWWHSLLLAPFSTVYFLLFFSVELIGKLLLALLAVLLWSGKWCFRLAALLTRPFTAVLFWLADRLLNWLHHWYSQALLWALRHPVQMLAPVLVLFSAAVLVTGQLGRELMPRVSQGEFTLEATLPTGSSLAKTDKALAPFEKYAARLKEVAMVSSVIGMSKDSVSTEEGEHIGKITVRLHPKKIDQENRLIALLNDQLAQKPELSDAKTNYPVLFTFKTPIEIEIRGYNLQSLKRLNAEVIAAVKKLPGFANIRSTVKRGNPELQIQFKRHLLGYYGLQIGDLSNRLKALLGQVSTHYIIRDKNIDILVRVANAEHLTVEQLGELMVTPDAEGPKKLKEIADIIRVEGFSEIRRVNQQRAAVITADISGMSLSTAVSRLKQTLDSIAMPEDFHFVLTGQNQEMEISLRSLKFALLLAIFLVYVVLASQFESLLHPFVIIATLPLALIGVVFTLYCLAIPISIVVYIGMILLAGIVVNNAIVLIDCINQLTRQGMTRQDAILRAGNLRLRPILMTTLTTVLGLLPMAGILPLGGGEGEEIRAPLAITVISGLSVSTLLTLVVIPVVYLLFERIKDCFSNFSAIPASPQES